MSHSAATRELAALLSGRVDTLGDPVTGWPSVLDVAARHRLLPGLWSALRARGIPSMPSTLGAPRSPLALLEDRYRTNTDRVHDLRRQLAQALDALDGAGVEAIPIKGGHLLVADALRDPAARETIDLDILVPTALAHRAEDALRRIGYSSRPDHPDHEPTDHQLAPLYPPSGSGSIEIHLEPMVARRRGFVTAADVRRSAEVHSSGRLLPDPTTAVTVLIGHAQLQEDGARMLELPVRALHDLQQLDPGFLGSVDWDQITRRFWALGPGGRIALAGFAVASDRYFGVKVPVPTRGGGAWLRAVEVAVDRRRAAERYRALAYLPIALRTERMERLYGSDSGLDLWRARGRHVVGSAARRLHP